MLRKALVAALLVVLPVCAHAQSAFPDLHGYQALLDQYTRRIAAKGEPFDTRFDYEQLYVDEKIWTLHRSARLEQVHAELLAANPAAMTAGERLAWGINTYNFLVIERITTHLLVPGRKFLRYKSADQITTSKGRFFEAYIAAVDGRNYTLEGFQRRFVLGDTTVVTAPRATARDPRLLFATNPGSIGAPPLMPRAYRPDSLDRQLDDVVRTALGLPRFLLVRTDPPSVCMSDWLAHRIADFGGTIPAMLQFVQDHAPSAVRAAMRKAKRTDVSRYLEESPLLNQVDHPKVVMPSAQERSAGS